MKIIYSLNPGNGAMTLVQAECDTIAESEEFMAWYEGALNKHGVDMAEPVAPIEKVEPVEVEISREMLSEAVMEVVKTKGRPVADSIMAQFGAKRISGIPDDKVAEAYKLAKEAL